MTLHYLTIHSEISSVYYTYFCSSFQSHATQRECSSGSGSGSGFFFGGLHSITRFLSFFLSDDDDGRIIKSSWVFSFYPPLAVFINVFVLLMLPSSFCHKYNMPTLVGGHSVYWDIPHFLISPIILDR
jgi:hypothetical protein